MDNHYLAEREGQLALSALHSAKRLRASGNGVLLHELSRALLLSCGGALDGERLSAFLAGFQRRCALTGEELRLLPDALRWSAVTLLDELYAEEVPDAKAAGAVFETLRWLSSAELTELLEEVDITEQLLRRDPSGIYPEMDETSRREYRAALSRMAEKLRTTEQRAAEKLLRSALRGDCDRTRHIGYYLYNKPLTGEQRAQNGRYYALLLVTAPFALAAGILAATGSVPCAVLSLLPVSGLVKALSDRIVLRFARVRRLPHLELPDGVPDEGRTLCVISVLLTGESSAAAACRHLEEYRASARDCGGNLLFGLLCDLPESSETLSRTEKALFDSLAREVDALNRRYGGGFFVFSRERIWSPDACLFSGWERKRGALTELARLLAGEMSSLRILSGEAALLANTQYILTLDADTRPEPGAIRALIGTALHPLCRPVIDEKKRIVSEGHAILSPRIETSANSTGKSDFARLFAPVGGTDPYSGAVGEVYMDLFESGGFAGKGLLHIPSFLSVMEGRIPDGQVLSHDALEGAFLRGGYVSDAALTDDFPASPLAFFRRANRWIRGDWQNLPWLGSRGQDLPPIERFRLFDSLRRSLAPVGELVAIAVSLLLPQGPLRIAGWLAAAAIFRPVLAELFSCLFRSVEEVRFRTLSGVLHGLGGELARTVTRFILLPWEAWVSVSAIALALWRMGVSRRNLLQWQTAEQGERRSDAPAHRKAARGTALWGIVFLILAPSVFGKAVGALWCFAPLLAASLTRAPGKYPLPEEDRVFLLDRAAEIWGYFRDHCTADEHFLPPDNVQLSPPVGRAHRTSPTNLGLAMVSCVCACELGIAEAPEAYGLLENMVSSAERLPRLRGHFYNWYDTKTLLPLAPRYISTVDSGNLCAALLTVAAAARARDLRPLADRAERLARKMDFRFLYDARRALFCIGCSAETGMLSEGYYDLLESEVRLTSYLAVALGQVPLRHWQRLSRAQVACDGFRGMVSWSGTMFEYLMPELFLPLVPRSRLWESARFALYVQKKHIFGKERVWGMSESAFCSLDDASSYRYKAHGCRELALARGMEKECVIAPYSSYLALAVSPRAAVDNLRRLSDRTDNSGPYGLWEAIDYTPGRTDGKEGVPVRSFMVHHLGMSLAAITNALTDGFLPRTLASYPEIRAFRGLLEEKPPLGGVLLHRQHETDGAKFTRDVPAPVVRSGKGVDYLAPACAVFSNGVYSLVFTENGISRAQYGSLLPYAAPRRPIGEGHGAELWLREGGKTLSLLPEGAEGVEFSRRFSETEAELSGRTDGILWTERIFLSAYHAGEVRRISVTREQPEREAELFFFLEPVLAPERDRIAHPSFSRLGLSTEVRDGALLVRRLRRGNIPEQFLAVASDSGCEFSSDFQTFPTRNGAGELCADTGWQSECCLCAAVKLPAGETESEITFSLAVGTESGDTVRAAKELLREETGYSVLPVEAKRLSPGAELLTGALSMAPSILFPRPSGDAVSLPTVPREALWELGLSGDFPIVAVRAEPPEYTAVREAVARHTMLRRGGVFYDLVILAGDRADYRQGSRRTLESELSVLCPDGSIGAPGGIHFADDSRAERVLAFAVDPHIPGRELRRPVLPPPCRRVGKVPAWHYGEHFDFHFSVSEGLPRRAWGLMLTNGALSWMASDTLTGSLWCRNARECPVIPWRGDPLALSGPERLWAESDGETIPLCGGEITFSPGAAVWEQRIGKAAIRLTAFIPPERNVRVFLIEADRPCRIRWCAPVQLAPEEADAAACRVSVSSDVLTAENIRCPFAGTKVFARASVPWESVCTDELSFLIGEAKTAPRSTFPALGGSVFCKGGECVLLLGTEDAPDLLSPEAAHSALERTAAYWRSLLCPTVVPPDIPPELLPWGQLWSGYQALAGRIWGRSSLYQSGGAIGFRDQLQDCVNLLSLDPSLARAHILSCAAHQFAEGDVQHWWHPGEENTDRGTRSRCSDDPLWLAWAVCAYAEGTGDTALLREYAPFLTAAPLEEHEKNRYEFPALSGESGSVWEHVSRAVSLVLRRGCGAHGLLLIGSGDWNDGFDDMGEGAESVWLTLFAAEVFDRLAALTDRIGENGGDALRREAASLAEAAENAWDGDRFLRGYYGDGTPLGGSCDGRTDSVVQSMAALCRRIPAGLADWALDTAMRELCDPKTHLSRLCVPPFSPEERSPGYVAAYGPGFRENGGQYTHASLWLALALARRGRRAEALDLLRELVLSAADTSTFLAEPFVVPADICAAPGPAGRCGWSWYTGSAGWFFRIFRELCADPVPDTE